MARYRSPIAQGLGEGLGSLAQGWANKFYQDKQKEQQQGLLNQIFSQRDPRAPMPASQMSGNLEQDAFQQRPVFDERNIGLLSQLNPQTLALLQSVHQMNQPSYFDATAGSTVMEKTPQGVKPIYQVPQRQITPSGGDWQGEFNPGGTPVFKTLPGTNKTYQPEFKMQFNPQTQKFEKIYKGVEGTQPAASQTANDPFQNLSGEDLLRKLPVGDQALLRSIASGQQNLQTAVSLRGGGASRREYFSKLLARTFPTYDENWIKGITSLKKDALVGPIAKGAQSMNMLVGHMATLKQAAEDLQNAPWQSYNTLNNWVRNNTGDPRVTAFNTAAKAVYTEGAATFKAGQGTASPTEQEIKDWSSLPNISNSPEQFQAFNDTLLKLLGSRLSSLGGRLRVPNMNVPEGFSLVNPKTKDILDSMGFDWGGQNATGLTGVQTQYTRTATNPKTGEKLGLNEATGKWEPITK